MPKLTTRIKTENGNYIAATPLFFGSIGFAWINANNEVLKPATANEWIFATTSWGDSENLPIIERGEFGEFEWNTEIETQSEPQRGTRPHRISGNIE